MRVGTTLYLLAASASVWALPANESSADTKASCLITTFAGINCGGVPGSTNPPERCLWIGDDPGPQKESYLLGEGCRTMKVYLHLDKTCSPRNPAREGFGYGPGCYNFYDITGGEKPKAAWFKYV